MRLQIETAGRIEQRVPSNERVKEASATSCRSIGKSVRMGGFLTGDGGGDEDGCQDVTQEEKAGASKFEHEVEARAVNPTMRAHIRWGFNSEVTSRPTEATNPARP